MARDRWGSRLGIILAVAGSAIGLGNFLRFPGLVAQHGGAFMIPYLVALFLLGIPLMWIEWTIGRFGGGFEHSTAPGMFHSMWEKNRFIKYFGVIGIFGPVVIFIYYTYIESWLLGYGVFALAGKYSQLTTHGEMATLLDNYRGLGNTPDLFLLAYLFFVVTFVLNILVVYFGIKGGIETVCKWAMPVLFLLAIVLVVKVMMLPAGEHGGVWDGFGFMWNPKWSELTSARVWFEAAGQIFFTLSVGIGVILTYASYLRKTDDVALSGLTAAMTNEVAEVILGGSIVIPAAVVFFGAQATGQAANSNFDLGFMTMPLVLQKMAGGSIFGLCWFLLLFLAGITSSISLAQPAIAFLEDEFNLSKKKAVLLFAAVTFALCQAPIFFLGRGVLGELDFWGGNFFLILFGTVEVILFAWVFGLDRAWTELHVGADITIPRFYRFIIKYITPAFLLFLLGFWLYDQWTPNVCMADVRNKAPGNVPYIVGTRIGLAILFAAIAVMVWVAWRRRASRRGTELATGDVAAGPGKAGEPQEPTS
jgi:SNF family Na+-dependent transporter